MSDRETAQAATDVTELKNKIAKLEQRAQDYETLAMRYDDESWKEYAEHLERRLSNRSLNRESPLCAAPNEGEVELLKYQLECLQKSFDKLGGLYNKAMNRLDWYDSAAVADIDRDARTDSNLQTGSEIEDERKDNGK